MVAGRPDEAEDLSFGDAVEESFVNIASRVVALYVK